MRKISIITCHNVYNHGASLQVYSLQETLKSHGYDVSIIDYQPEHLGGKFSFTAINNPKYSNIVLKFMYLLFKVPSRLLSLLRKSAFDRFTSKYLNLSKIKYYKYEELCAVPPISDIYICGSDQIWNPLFKNGKDPAFYLDFGPDNVVRMAYAPSAAVEKLTDEDVKLMVPKIDKLDYVSTREMLTKKMLQPQVSKEITHVADPVFLQSREFWVSLGTKHFNSDYLVVQDFDGSQLIKETCLRLSKEYGLKIYALNKLRDKYYDRHFHYSGPTIMIDLIKSARFVVTNSYHMIVYSIIFKKDFYVVNRQDDLNSRLKDLLSLLKLECRSLMSCSDMMINSIDYTKVDPILQEHIYSSINYLAKIEKCYK